MRSSVSMVMRLPSRNRCTSLPSLTARRPNVVSAMSKRRQKSEIWLRISSFFIRQEGRAGGWDKGGQEPIALSSYHRLPTKETPAAPRRQLTYSDAIPCKKLNLWANMFGRYCVAALLFVAVRHCTCGLSHRQPGRSFRDRLCAHRRAAGPGRARSVGLAEIRRAQTRAVRPEDHRRSRAIARQARLSAAGSRRAVQIRQGMRSAAACAQSIGRVSCRGSRCNWRADQSRSAPASRRSSRAAAPPRLEPENRPRRPTGGPCQHIPAAEIALRRLLLIPALLAAALWPAPGHAQARSQFGPLCTTETTPADQMIDACSKLIALKVFSGEKL